MDDPLMTAYLGTLDPSLTGDKLSGQLGDRSSDPGDPDLDLDQSDLPADRQAAIDACLMCELPECTQADDPTNCRLAYVLQGLNLGTAPPAGAPARTRRRPHRRISIPHLLTTIDSLAAQKKRATVRAVARALDVPVSAAHEALRRATEEGLLVPIKQGQKRTGCSLTPAGRATLDHSH